MQILPVVDKKEHLIFLQLPLKIYEKDFNWIRPLDKDVEDVFDSKKNKAFRFGEVKRWILFDEQAQVIGRIAAFINKKYKNKGDDIPVGGIGFFECINNQVAADLLFDTARQWLKEKNMEAMDGPINFGERDKWWGLVTEGFDEPLYGMNYNPPYYKQLFENYGFLPFYHQICMGMDPQKKLNDKIWQRYHLFANDSDYSLSTLKKNNLVKFSGDFTEVYNKAWAGHGGMKTISKEQALIMFKKMKPVIDEKVICFAYHKNSPIAVFINLPDLNQWFKYLNGKFGLLQKLYFLWLKQTKINPKLTGLVFGVVPEFQGKGVDSYIIGGLANNIQNEKSSYKKYEMQWLGDFNPKMINIAKGLGDVHQSRNLTTYRYLFDRTKPFKRHPILSESDR